LLSVSATTTTKNIRDSESSFLATINCNCHFGLNKLNNQPAISHKLQAIATLTAMTGLLKKSTAKLLQKSKL
jgi:uncharacterized membrane protein